MADGNDPAQVVFVAGRVRAHEMFLLGVSVLTGVAYLVGTPPSASLAAVLPAWEVRVWSTAMVVSGVVGLAGCLWRRRVELGLRLEQAGMLIGAGAIGLLCVTAFAYSGTRALAGGLTFAAWGCANLYRAWQIRRDLVGLRG